MRKKESVDAEIKRREKKLKDQRQRWHRFSYKVKTSKTPKIFRMWRDHAEISINKQLEKLEELKAI